MFLYNFASLMLAILCLECVLNDSLGDKNPRDALGSKNSVQNRGTWDSAMRHMYVEMSLRTQR